MKLYFKECRKIATSVIYYVFLIFLVVSWYQNYFGLTQQEINWAGGGKAPEYTFDRPLLSKPSTEDSDYGSKTVENPERIMVGATDALLSEYKVNCYATYPFGYYKAVVLDHEKQERILAILCEITGLTSEQLSNLPAGYFPATNGTIFHMEQEEENADSGLSITMGDKAGKTGDEYEITIVGDGSDDAEASSGKDGNSTTEEKDYTKIFVSQVSYEHFKELMNEVEEIIGEKGSRYSMEMMITYFGVTGMTYDEAMADYTQTIEKDRITGGFARLFCDYTGQTLGLYPVFLVIAIWLKDKRSRMEELIYSRESSSAKLLTARYLACVTMILFPVILLSFESLIPLIRFGAEQNLTVDYFAFLKYILWWLLPTIMVVSAAGTFLTLLTDTPVAILMQFAWWMIDRGVTGLSGDTKWFTLMIRHNTLRGYDVIQDSLKIIWLNRTMMILASIVLLVCSTWILGQKRKGKMNAAVIYRKWISAFKGKLEAIHKK